MTIPHFYRASVTYTERLIPIMLEEQNSRLATSVEKTSPSGLEILGFFDNRNDPVHISKDRVDPVVGNFDDLIQRVKDDEVGLINFAVSLSRQDCTSSIIDGLRDTATSVPLVPEFLSTIYCIHVGLITDLCLHLISSNHHFMSVDG